MRIVITDSGLGGLSIAAKLYEAIKANASTGHVRVIFANALLANSKGYNTFSDTEEKLRIFDRALRGFRKHLAPDRLAIACNTLSVLYEDTAFARNAKVPVMDIVSIGVEAFREKFQTLAEYNLILLGTETTIESGQHFRKLQEHGIASERIIPRSCPHLASEIEKEPGGRKTGNIVFNSLSSAQKRIKTGDLPTLIYLACTHYAYIEEQIKKTARELGYHDVHVFDPNDAMVAAMFSKLDGASALRNKSAGTVSIEVVTRTPFLGIEVKSIGNLLQFVSADTVKALQHHIVQEDLF